MKHVYFISFASLILLAACKKDKISGSGTTVYETLPLNNFTAVQVSGPTMVIIEKGSQFSVKTNGSDNLMPLFEANVNNGVLDLHWKTNEQIERSDLTVHVTLPDLKSVKVLGKSAVNVFGPFSGSEMAVTVSGSGSVYLDHQSADNFFVTVSGVGVIAGMGMVSQVNAIGMTCKKAVVDLTGNGRVELTCLNELKVRIAGHGIVSYMGNPVMTSDISGGGAVYKR